jgi:hypothetical protein
MNTQSVLLSELSEAPQNSLKNLIHDETIGASWGYWTSYGYFRTL